MTNFVKNGSAYRLVADANLIIDKKLPAQTFSVEFDPERSEFFLLSVESHNIGKIYGDSEAKADRIIRTFLDRKSSTGVLLSGEKGSGKTMLAKMISIKAMRDHGIPTILINKAHSGEAFNRFIQSIDQPCVIIFDEFEKIYHEDKDQNSLLTLLDGVYATHKLFILTTNDTFGINQHMKNRPGRLFYHLEYAGLDIDFIREYCEDVLTFDKENNIEDIISIAQLFERFNFDMLKALVEEINRFKESAKTAIKMMNIKLNAGQMSMYECKLFRSGKELKLFETEHQINPFLKFSLWYHEETKDADILFTPNDIKEITDSGRRFTFKKDEFVAIISKMNTSMNSFF